MPNIFDIEAELVQIAEAYDTLEGAEETPEVLAAVETYFAGLLEDRDRKIDAYCLLINDFTAKAKAKAEEAARIKKLADSDAAAARRMKDRLKDFMTFAGVRKLEGAFRKASIAGNGGLPPLLVKEEYESDATKAPPEYQVVTVTLNSDALRAALNEIEARIAERVAAYSADLAAEYGPKLSKEEKAVVKAKAEAFELELRKDPEFQHEVACYGERGGARADLMNRDYSLPLVAAPARLVSTRWQVQDSKGKQIAHLGNDKATAQEFAAAPDMRQALEHLAACVIEGRNASAALDEAKAALDKANGVIHE